MKKGILVGLLMLVCGWMVSPAMAIEVRALGVNEMAGHMGANLVMTIDYSEFTETSDNTAEGLTYAVETGQAWALQYVEIEKQFAVGTTSTALTVLVGHGGDADQWLVSSAIGADGQARFGHFGTGAGGGFTLNSADDMTFQFTPSGGYALADLTKGKARFYFKLVD